jgi:hypothetical protein
MTSFLPVYERTSATTALRFALYKRVPKWLSLMTGQTFLPLHMSDNWASRLCTPVGIVNEFNRAMRYALAVCVQAVFAGCLRTLATVSKTS